jgi:hypothetical protein
MQISFVRVIYSDSHKPHNPCFFLIGVVGGGVQLVPLGTAATNRPIVLARVNMMMEKLVEG